MLGWFIFYSLALLCLELGPLYFSPLLSSPVSLLSPGPRPPPSQSFIFVVPVGVAGCRRVSPGAAGCRRAPPSKIVVFHRFFVHWRPQIVKNRCFFNVFRTKSLKIVENRCFSIVFRTNSSKIVENRCFSIVFRTFSFQHR